MSYLFCGRQDWMEGDSWEGLDENCVLSTSSCNEDISAWDTSGVTRMFGMFWFASSFNQNIGGWSIENVNEMGHMFNSASSFDQEGHSQIRRATLAHLGRAAARDLPFGTRTPGEA